MIIHLFMPPLRSYVELQRRNYKYFVPPGLQQGFINAPS
jgi:hypothetical protein